MTKTLPLLWAYTARGSSAHAQINTLHPRVLPYKVTSGMVVRTTEIMIVFIVSDVSQNRGSRRARGQKSIFRTFLLCVYLAVATQSYGIYYSTCTRDSPGIYVHLYVYQVQCATAVSYS